MTELHLVLGYASSALAVATLLAALAGLVVGARVRLLVDRLILLSVAALLTAALVGLPLPLLADPPPDPLHLLYAVAGPLALLGGRYLGRGASMRRRSAFVAIAATAVLGVIYRLFTTGVPAS